MADYYTHFSCLFDVTTAANAERAEEIRDELVSYYDSDEGVELGFDMKRNEDIGPGSLWISSDGEGDPEHVVAFILRCAVVFDMKGTWGFCWANTCSRLRMDGFGGGAQIVDLAKRTSTEWIDLAQWVLLRDTDHGADKATTSEGASAPLEPGAGL